MANGTAILARWRRLVASTIALIPLHWAMCAVLYPLTTVAIKMASKVSAFFVIVFFIATLPAARAKRCQYLPNGGVQ